MSLQNNHVNDQENKKKSFFITSSSSMESDSESVSSYQAYKVKQLEWSLRVLIIGIVISIILLAVDLYRDNSLHVRITDLEKNISNFEIEINNLPDDERIKLIENKLENDKNILKCFEFKNYWQYKDCFK